MIGVPKRSLAKATAVSTTIRNVVFWAVVSAVVASSACGRSGNGGGSQLVSTAVSAPAEPLLQQSDLVYQGAFRVPKGSYGASTKTSTLSYGGESLSFNPKRDSLFILGHLDSEKLLLEMTIPPVVNSNNLSDLKTADVLQGGIDITGGLGYDKLGVGNTAIVNGARPGSLLVYQNRLFGNAWASYDGENKAANSHFSANLDWSAGSGFQGFYRVGENPINKASCNGGFVGGYMGLVPPQWRGSFGGRPALTGLGGTPVITRSSFGPSAWAFDPADLGVLDPAPATLLVGYPSTNRSLGNYTVGNLVYNSTSEVRGVVFPVGAGSVLFFGRHGLGADHFGAGTTFTGQTSYGPATSNLSEVGRTASSVPNTCGSTVVAGGDVCSYDPADSSKGVHGYPYVYRIWAYRASDLARVFQRDLNPWDVQPYGVWDLPLPFAVPVARIQSATYDPATQRIFLSQQAGDRPGMEPFPLIHVFQVRIPPAAK
jgi:hypothetical protein